MIEPTDEMYEALFDAGDASGGEFASKEDVLRGLAAVLALVERDYDVRPSRQNVAPCGAVGPDGLLCERNPHTPDSTHGALVNDCLVRW